MRLIRFAVYFLLAICSNVARSDCDNGSLDKNKDFSIGPIDWHLFYTDNTNAYHPGGSGLPPGLTNDYVSGTRATLLKSWIQSNYARQVTDLGMPTYWVSTLPNFNVLIHDITTWDSVTQNNANVYGFYNWDCFVMDSGDAQSASTNAEPMMWKTSAHEMFHSIQQRFLENAGAPYHGSSTYFGYGLVEGTARCMDDRWYKFEDAGTFSGSFQGAADSFLKAPGTSLADASYNAGFFWSYCCEQYGGQQIEPQRGFDFVSALWQKVATRAADKEIDVFADVDGTIKQFDPSQSLDDTFHDFAICNFTHNLSVTSLTDYARYRYIDEMSCCNGGAPAYTTVPRKTLSFPSLGGSNLSTFSANYYVSPSLSNYSCMAAGFRVTADEELACAIIGIQGSTNVTLIDRGRGTDWGRTFIISPGKPLERFGAVVAGLSQGSSYSYYADSGSVTNTILRPTFTYQAFPGVHDHPGQFLARVLVQGPLALEPNGAGARSVLGLQRDDFTVTVGTNRAQVISAGYVGGEYWLTIQAPAQHADGLYDLKISLCGDNAAFTSLLSVLYGDIIVNHVIAMDNSGSMNAPAAATKLEVAKDAAQLYIDSISENDRVGFVKFSGDGSECNEDGTAVPTNRLLEANGLVKLLFKMGVELLAPSNLTSIGDGLWSAQNLLGTSPPTNKVVINNILLLSDGMENESRYWAKTNCISGGMTVKDRIMSTGTWVNAIALGPDSDQALMQDIGTSTHGDYSYVDVSDTTTTPFSSLPLPLSGSGNLSMPNNLFDTFIHALERAKNLERLSFTDISLAAGVTSTSVIAVTEGSVMNARFIYAWDRQHVPINVSLYGPGTNLFAGAIVYTSDTHKVYLVTNAIGTGAYSAVISSSSNAQLIAALVGTPSNAAHVELAISQIHSTSQGNMTSDEALREGFQQGVPVTILAIATDFGGPILGANMDVIVTRPDNSTACGPLKLFDDGAHDDGRAGDGVYGFVFRDTAQASTVGNDRDLNPTNALPPQRGTYRVKLAASGISGGGPFLREARKAFHVYKRVEWDSDADGLPDTWENFYGGSLAMQPNADPDNDGLSNSSECYSGSHPLDPDSDNGGESDGSEFAHGRCPMVPTDDVMPRLLDVTIMREHDDLNSVTLLPNANLIHFPRANAYSNMEIWRATNAAGPFGLVTNLALTKGGPASHHDQGLVNGVTYFYKLRAIGTAGSATPFSRIISATALSSPWPPFGSVAINHDFDRTDRTNVLITLRHGFDATQFRFSNTGITGAEPLQPIQTNNIVRTIVPPAIVPGTSRVFVQFANAAGTLSDIYFDDIVYDPSTAGNLDDDGDGIADTNEVFRYFTDQFNSDTDRDGLTDSNELFVAFTDPLRDDTDSDGVLDGAETNGLSPVNADTDGDGLPDGWERAYGLNPTNSADAMLDTDGDGLGNYEEYLTGTLPNNSASYFAQRMIQPLSGNLYTVEIPSVRGVTYQLYASSTLINPSWNPGSTFTATVSRLVISAPVPPSATNLFYQVRRKP